jgi:hypothetical protein
VNPSPMTPEMCPECGTGDAEYGVHESGCPSGYPTIDDTERERDEMAGWREYADRLEGTARAYHVASGAKGLRKDAARFLQSEAERLEREATGWREMASQRK